MRSSFCRLFKMITILHLHVQQNKYPEAKRSWHVVDLGSASMQTASLASHGDNGTLIRTGPVDLRAASVFPHDDASASLMLTASFASHGDNGTLIRTGPVDVRAASVFPPDDASASLMQPASFASHGDNEHSFAQAP